MTAPAWWRGACRLAAAAVRADVRKLDKQAKGGLLVDAEQRRALGMIADWLDAAQHQGPHVLVGLALQGSLSDVLEKARAEKAKEPAGFKMGGGS